MKALDKIKDLLASSDQIHLTGIGQFLELNIKKLKNGLRLDDGANDNGYKKLPSSESENYDDLESEVIKTIEAERGRCLNEFNNHLTTYNQRLANLNIEARLTQVTLAAKEAIGNFKSQIHQGQDDLEIARDNVDKHTNQLKYFTLEQGLKRPGIYKFKY